MRLYDGRPVIGEGAGLKRIFKFSVGVGARAMHADGYKIEN